MPCKLTLARLLRYLSALPPFIRSPTATNLTAARAEKRPGSVRVALQVERSQRCAYDYLFSCTTLKYARLNKACFMCGRETSPKKIV